jgi:hypothetical protein
MTVPANRLRILLEVGKKRRVVAAATDWPGLDRWGTSEDDAIAKLQAYLPRYAGVAGRAGLADAFARARTIEVIERTPGSSSTDFWGIAHVPSVFEAEPMSDADLERRLTLLGAAWAEFDAIAQRSPSVLKPAGRTEGRPRDSVIRHVYGSEPEQMTRKVEVRTPLDEVQTPAGLDAHRLATLEAIRAYHDAGRNARTWPIPFLIRRIAHHVMDHGWELQDRA